VKRDSPRAPTALHGSSDLKFLPIEKVNAIADCLENMFTRHDLCDEHNERWMGACDQAMLEIDDKKKKPAPEKIRLCDMQKLYSLWNYERPVELNAS
jgi:hypothetical protein